MVRCDKDASTLSGGLILSHSNGVNLTVIVTEPLGLVRLWDKYRWGAWRATAWDGETVFKMVSYFFLHHGTVTVRVAKISSGTLLQQKLHVPSHCPTGSCLTCAVTWTCLSISAAPGRPTAGLWSAELAAGCPQGKKRANDITGMLILASA